MMRRHMHTGALAAALLVAACAPLLTGAATRGLAAAQAPGEGSPFTPDQLLILREGKELAQLNVAARMTSEAPNVTALVPTNAAFARLFARLNTTKAALYADQARALAIARMHIIPFRVLLAGLRDGQALPTRNPSAKITVSRGGAGSVVLLRNAACPACGPPARVIVGDVQILGPPDSIARGDRSLLILISEVLLPWL